jgi:hypothetical protein
MGSVPTTTMLQQPHNQEDTVRIQTDMTLNNKDLNQRPDSSTSPILEVKDNGVLCGREEGSPISTVENICSVE